MNSDDEPVTPSALVFNILALLISPLFAGTWLAAVYLTFKFVTGWFGY